MKVFLMHRDRDFDLDWERVRAATEIPHARVRGGKDLDLDRDLPPQAADLTQDLGLDQLFDAMARGDNFLREVARKAVLSSLTDPQEIVYRQQVLGDCVAHPTVIRELYTIAVEAIEGERKVFRTSLQLPDSVLYSAIEVMGLFVGLLKQLRGIADEQAPQFRSAGFAAFFAMLQRELDDSYFRSVEEHLKQLKFRHGVLVSARLGKGNKGVDYVLRALPDTKQRWWQWLTPDDQPAYTLTIGERDESGAQALAELRGRGINLAANALAQSAEHILRFFGMLRAELGFYLGCLNARQQLTEKGEPLCIPAPIAPGTPALACRGLYDVGLSLRLTGRVVGNDVRADGKPLVIITGANQGGKSTFLRSVGLAQLMLQCGMFVGAEAFHASVCDGLFTHYRREEDVTMTSGKLDEELARMSAIIDRVRPNGLVLFNESFAATNEREGAAIAGGIIAALVEAGIRVCFVTHSFELAHGLQREGRDDTLFLRAERQSDGGRTFKLVEGEPLPTSYGADLYRQIFGDDPGVAPTTRRQGQGGHTPPMRGVTPVARERSCD
jgi:hypothetical protein